ncbi:MAG: FliH/SctL family protein [bacterium]
MDSLHREQLERNVLKGEQLRKGTPHVITTRQGEGLQRTEADELRLKFEQPLREQREDEQARELLSQAEAQATELMELARRDAQRILDEAREQAEALRARSEAEAEARLAQLEPQLRSTIDNEYRERHTAGLKALADAASALENGRSEMLAALELPAFELVLQIARRLLQSELERSPQYVLGLIRSGLGLLGEGRPISLRLNPALVHTVSEDPRLATLLSAGNSRTPLILEPDPQLAAQAFQLVTDSGEVAFDIDDSLQRLDELLARQLFPGVKVGPPAPSEEAGNG